MLDTTGVQAFAGVVSIDSNCFYSSCCRDINKWYSMEVENNGPVVISSHALADMVSHVCSGTKTQRTAKIEEGEMIVDRLENLGFGLGECNLAAITFAANSSQLFVCNLLDEG